MACPSPYPKFLRAVIAPVRKEQVSGMWLLEIARVPSRHQVIHKRV